jgi:hypothetical protein
MTRAEIIDYITYKRLSEDKMYELIDRVIDSTELSREFGLTAYEKYNSHNYFNFNIFLYIKNVKRYRYRFYTY